MAENILITGGTGLVGSYLAQMLTRRGHNVSILSRSKSKHSGNNTIWWDPEKGLIDREAISNISGVIHLAGSNITSGIWTKRGRQSLLRSRVKSGELLFRTFSDCKAKPKTFITASGVSYYGAITTSHVFTESDPPGSDFLANLCIEWEKIAGAFKSAGTRSVIIRTAVVLAGTDSILQKLKIPFQLGFSTFPGSGYQYLPWIHIKDLCSVYLRALEDNSMEGPYNAVAPDHVTVRYFVREFARILNRKIWLPPVPEFVIKVLPEDGTRLLLEGSRISSDKIVQTGFSFSFEELKTALSDLLSDN